LHEFGCGTRFKFPDCGGERLASFVEAEGLVGVEDSWVRGEIMGERRGWEGEGGGKGKGKGKGTYDCSD
jgi:hypothetical protein